MTDKPVPRPDLKPNSAKQNGFTLVELLVVLAIIAMLVALFFPATRGSGEAARRSICKLNLKQIGLALHNYHDAYGAFPPAYTVDAAGKRLHSWRTLILPYLDQKPLYERIDLSKPWDDPANAEAFKTRLAVYACPDADGPENHTSYLAVVSPNSCLQPNQPRKISEITDGAGNTLMVIEVAAWQAVPWMSPRDADESMVLGVSPESTLNHSGGGHALFVDGRVQFLLDDMPIAERRAMISVAGGDN